VVQHRRGLWLALACLMACRSAGTEPGPPSTAPDITGVADVAPVQPPKPANCDDKDPCTEDSQPPSQGCRHERILGCRSCTSSETCQNTHPCLKEKCEEGRCVSFLSPNDVYCDAAADGSCTRFACDELGGCTVSTSLPAGTGCGEATACMGKECDGAGSCQWATHPGKPCDPGGPLPPCFEASCNEKATCGAPTPGLPCSTPTVCSQSKCDATGACIATFNVGAKCSDEDPCLESTCNSQGLCESVILAGKACTVGSNLCLAKGVCDSSGLCQAASPAGQPCLSPPNACLEATCDDQGSCGDPKPLIGKACAQVPACHVGVCDDKGFCAAKLSPVGTACVGDAICMGPGKCDGQGKCQASVQTGKLCGTNTDPCHELRCDDKGSCKPVLTVAKTCFDTGDPCRPNQCDALGKCVPAIAAGGPCQVGAPCYASQGTCNAQGTCVSAPATGKACDGGPCVEQATCDASGLCTGKVKVGASCPAPLCHEPGTAACQADGTCAGKAVADKTSCDTVDSCVAGSVCVGGVCQLGAKVALCPGVPDCQAAVCCAGAALKLAVCAGAAGKCALLPPVVGVPCSGTGDCNLGLCGLSAGASECKPWWDTCVEYAWACQQSACVGAKCVKAPPTDCDDKLPCTDDECTYKGNCEHEPTNEATSCGPGRQCKQGQCILL